MADAEVDWAREPPARKTTPGKCSRFINLRVIALFIRGLAVFSGAMTCVSSIVGFHTVKTVYNVGNSEVVHVSGASGANLTFRNLAVFLGVQLCVLLFCGLLIVLSELRLKWMRNRLLRAFGFLNSRIGRGIFELIVGIFLGVVANLFSRIIAGTTGACGAAQIILSFLVKDEVHKGSALEQPGLVGKSSKKKKDTAALAREIKWGEDSPQDVEATDASLSETDVARPAAAPSRRAAGMSSAPTSGAVTTEYEVNPFLSS